MFLHHFLEALLGGGAIDAVEDAADLGGDAGTLIEPRHVGLGVLLEMKLTALPGHAREDGPAGGLESGMVITDEEPHAAESALLQPGEERPPMHFGFAQGRTDAEDAAFAGRLHARGDEYRAVEDLSVATNLFITGIKDDVGNLSQGGVAPGFQKTVQPGGALADLGGTDRMAAELLDDGGDPSGGDAWTYISARASLRACSLRNPFSKALG